MKDELDIFGSYVACAGGFVLLAGVLCQNFALGLLGFALGIIGLFLPR